MKIRALSKHHSIFGGHAKVMAFILVGFVSACNPLGSVTAVDESFGKRTTGLTTVAFDWDFNTASDYSISNSSQLVIESGSVTLKDLNSTAQTDDAFTGTHNATYFSGSKFTLKDSSYGELSADWTPEFSSLVGYWKLNGNYLDSTSNGNTGTGTNTTFSTNRVLGSNAATFDGSTTYIEIPTTPTLKPTEEMTTCAWVFPRNITQDYAGIFSPRTTNTNNGNILALHSTGRVRYMNYNGSGYANNAITDPNVIALGAWSHICGTFKTNSVANIYVNSVLVGSQPVTGSVVYGVTENLRIGKDGATASTFTGEIDEVALWNKALTADDISTLYQRQSQVFAHDTSLNSTWAPQWSSLKGYWKMDGNWLDSSGNGNNGTASGNTTFSTTSAVGTFAGEFNVAGNNDTVTIPDSNSLDFSSQMTVSLWMYFTGNAVNNINFIGKANNTADAQFMLYYSGNDHSFYFFANAGGAWSQISGATNLEEDRWYYITLAYDSSLGGQLYIDGQKVGARMGSGVLATNSASLNIGRYFNNNDFSGYLDDVAIWSAELTEAEIQLIYNRQKQKHSGIYTSQVIDSTSSSSSWSALSWISELPFLKELTGSAGNESASDYSSIYTANTLNNGLLGLWHFENSLADSSGNSKTLAETWNGESMSSVLPAMGVYSAHFDGTAARYVRTTFSEISNAGTYTLSLWIRPEIAAGSKATIFSDGPNSSDRHAISLLGTEVCYGRYNGTTWASKSAAVELGKWNHVVAINVGGTYSLYVNGQASTGTADAYGGSGEFLIGGNSSAPNADFQGYIDEVALWSRQLSTTEISQLFRRGANRTKFQIRSCDDSACSGESWMGPDGTSTTWFSELNNCTGLNTLGGCNLLAGDSVGVGSPSLSFSDFASVGSGLVVNTNRFFQYRILMESGDPTTAPVLPSFSSVSVLPSHYSTSSPAVTVLTGPKYSIWNSISEQKTGSCSTTYQASNDGMNWYYYNGSRWLVASGVAESSEISVLNAGASTFSTQVGTGTLYIKAYLTSDGTNSCSLQTVGASVQQ